MANLTLHTQIDIQATMERIWAILADFEAYPTWNPFITQLRGELALGQQLHARIDGMRFRPTVTQWEPPYAFAWLGKLWFKGLFDGAHAFRLEALSDQTTRLHHSESFSGLLVPLFEKQLMTKTKAGFEAMNEALKRRAESLVEDS